MSGLTPTDDRLSRAFERAVLSSSFVGGSPIELDRSLDSLARLDGYLDAIDADSLATPIREAMLTAYLRAVSDAFLGAPDDEAARVAADRLQRRVPLAGYADQLVRRRPDGDRATAPAARARAVTLRVLCPPDVDWYTVRGLVQGVLPLLQGGTETFEEDGQIHLIDDADEMRLDLEPNPDGDEASLTVVFLVGAGQDRASQAIAVWQALHEAAPAFAVAYDPDTLAGLRYMRGGLKDAAPDLFFFARAAAFRAGGVAMILEAPCQSRLLPGNDVMLAACVRSRELAEYLTLLNRWPHLEVDPLDAVPDPEAMPPRLDQARPATDADAADMTITRWATVFREAMLTWYGRQAEIGWTLADLAKADTYLEEAHRDRPSGADPSTLPYRAQLVGAYLFSILVPEEGRAIFMEPPTSSVVEKGGERRSPWTMAWQRLQEGRGKGFP